MIAGSLITLAIMFWVGYAAASSDREWPTVAAISVTVALVLVLTLVGAITLIKS